MNYDRTQGTRGGRGGVGEEALHHLPERHLSFVASSSSPWAEESDLIRRPAGDEMCLAPRASLSLGWRPVRRTTIELGIVIEILEFLGNGFIVIL